MTIHTWFRSSTPSEQEPGNCPAQRNTVRSSPTFLWHRERSVVSLIRKGCKQTSVHRHPLPLPGFLCCNLQHPQDCSSSAPLLSEIRKGKFTSTFNLALYHPPSILQFWKRAYIHKLARWAKLPDEARVLEPTRTTQVQATWGSTPVGDLLKDRIR